MDLAKTPARRDETRNIYILGFGTAYIRGLTIIYFDNLFDEWITQTIVIRLCNNNNNHDYDSHEKIYIIWYI